MRLAALILLALLIAGDVSAEVVSLEVRVDGKPRAGFAVGYFDDEHRERAATDARGVAVLRFRGRAPTLIVGWTLWPASGDYVFRDARGGGGRWRVDAVRSAAWRQRNHPRPCDAWRAILDIPRGTLATESAADDDQWYAGLTPRQVANCVEIARIETVVGSKAPWYLYELRERPRACIGGKFAAEEDWTAWYRGLLAEATHASPGLCLEDWERWWVKKGYPSVPLP